LHEVARLAEDCLDQRQVAAVERKAEHPGVVGDVP
jgi:hypothetical protein